MPACRTNFDCDNLEQFLANLGGGSRFKGKMEKGKENPGQSGYGGSNARASLAFPTATNHRSRTGRPVFVRAAAGIQVSHHASTPTMASLCCRILYLDCRVFWVALPMQDRIPAAWVGTAECNVASVPRISLSCRAHHLS